MARISQREARQLRKRVAELEHTFYLQRRVWAQEYTGGTHIGTVKFGNLESPIPVAVRTARKLKHAVVAIADDSGSIHLYALPHAKESI